MPETPHLALLGFAAAGGLAVVILPLGVSWAFAALVLRIIGTVLTYVCFPWLLIPGLPSELLVWLCFWLLPSIPAAFTPNILTAIGLAWIPALLLRLILVQLAGRLLWTALLSLPPVTSMFTRLGVQSIAMETPSVSGGSAIWKAGAVWRLCFKLDKGLICDSVQPTSLKTMAFRMTGLALTSVELFIPVLPLGFLHDFHLTITGLEMDATVVGMDWLTLESATFQPRQTIALRLQQLKLQLCLVRVTNWDLSKWVRWQDELLIATTSDFRVQIVETPERSSTPVGSADDISVELKLASANAAVSLSHEGAISIRAGIGNVCLERKSNRSKHDDGPQQILKVVPDGGDLMPELLLKLDFRKSLLVHGRISQMEIVTDMRAWDLLAVAQASLNYQSCPPTLSDPVDRRLWQLFEFVKSPSSLTASEYELHFAIQGDRKLTKLFEGKMEQRDCMIGRISAHESKPIHVAQLLLLFKGLDERLKDNFGSAEASCRTIRQQLSDNTLLRYVIDRDSSIKRTAVQLYRAKPFQSWCDYLLAPENRLLANADANISVDQLKEQIQSGWMPVQPSDTLLARLYRALSSSSSKGQSERTFNVAVAAEMAGAQGLVESIVMPPLIGNVKMQGSRLVNDLKHSIQEMTGHETKSIQIFNHLNHVELLDDHRMHEYGTPESPDGPTTVLLRVKNMMSPACSTSSSWKFVAIDVTLDVGLPRVRLSDMFTHNSLTSAQILVDCGYLRVRATNSTQADFARKELSVLPHDVTIQISNTTGECRGLSVTVEKTISAFVAEMQALAPRKGFEHNKVSRTMLDQMQSLYSNSVCVDEKTEAKSDHELNNAENDMLTLDELEKWFLHHEKLAQAMLSSTIVENIFVSVAMCQTYLPEPIFRLHPGCSGSASSRTLVELGGLNIEIDLIDLPVISSCLKAVTMGLESMSRTTAAAIDLPLICVPENINVQEHKQVHLQCDETIKSLDVYLCAMEPKVDEHPILRPSFARDCAELTFSISRNCRPSMSLCTAVRLVDCHLLTAGMRVCGELYVHVINENSLVGHWEPIIEPWNVSFKYEVASTMEHANADERKHDLIDISAAFLHMNLTYSVLQDLSEFISLSSMDGDLQARHRVGCGFAMVNNSGETLHFRAREAASAQSSDWSTLQTGQIALLPPDLLQSFAIGQETTSRILDVRVGDGSSVSISNLHRGKSQHLQHHEDSLAELMYRVCDARNGSRVLEFCSNLRISNHTSVTLQIRFSAGDDKRILELQAQDQEVPVPVGYFDSDTLVSVRPEPLLPDGSQAIDATDKTYPWSAAFELKLPVRSELSREATGDRHSGIGSIRCEAGAAHVESFYCHYGWETEANAVFQIGTQSTTRILAFRPCLKVANMLPHSVRLVDSADKNSSYALAPGESRYLSCRGDWWKLPTQPAAVAIGIGNLSRLTRDQHDWLLHVFDTMRRTRAHGLSEIPEKVHVADMKNLESVLKVLFHDVHDGRYICANFLSSMESVGKKHDGWVSREQFLDFFRFGPSTENMDNKKVICYHQGLLSDSVSQQYTAVSSRQVVDLCGDPIMHKDSKPTTNVSTFGMMLENVISSSESQQSDVSHDLLKSVQSTWSMACGDADDPECVSESLCITVKRKSEHSELIQVDKVNLTYSFQPGEGVMLELWSPLWVVNRTPMDFDLRLNGDPENTHTVPHAPDEEERTLQFLDQSITTTKSIQYSLAWTNGSPDNTFQIRKLQRGHSGSMETEAFSKSTDITDTYYSMVGINLPDHDGSTETTHARVVSALAPAPFSKSRVLTINPPLVARNLSKYVLRLRNSSTNGPDEVLRQDEEKCLSVTAGKDNIRVAVQENVAGTHLDDTVELMWSRAQCLPLPAEEMGGGDNSAYSSSNTIFSVHPDPNDWSDVKHVIAFAPEHGVLIFRDAAAAPYRIANESCCRFEFFANCNRDTCKTCNDESRRRILTGPTNSAPIWCDAGNDAMEITVVVLRGSEGVKKTSNLQHNDTPDLVNETQRRVFSLKSVGQLPDWEITPDIVLQPSVLCTKSGRTLHLRSSTSCGAHVSAPMKTFVNMEGMQLSLTTRTQEELLRLRVDSVDFSSVPAGLLHVTVIGASLWVEDSTLLGLFHSMDPFCVISVDGETKKTAVCKNTIEPIWATAHDLQDCRDFKYNFCTQTADKLLIQIFDEELSGLIEDKLIGQASIELAACVQIPGVVFNEDITLKLMCPDSGAAVGTVRVLIAYDNTPISQPQQVQLVTSPLVLEDRLLWVENDKSSQVLKLGDRNGICFTAKQYSRDCLGHPLTVPHLKKVSLHVGAVGVRLTTKFLHGICDYYSTLLLLRLHENFDLKRKQNAHRSMKALSEQVRTLVPPALAQMNCSPIYCEEADNVVFDELEFRLTTKIETFVQNLRSDPAVETICASQGINLNHMFSGFLGAFSLDLVSYLVSLHFNIKIDAATAPKAESLKFEMDVNELWRQMYEKMDHLGAGIYFAILKAVTPNPFHFLTSQVESTFRNTRDEFLPVATKAAEDDADDEITANQPLDFDPDEHHLRPSDYSLFHCGVGIASTAVDGQGLNLALNRAQDRREAREIDRFTLSRRHKQLSELSVELFKAEAAEAEAKAAQRRRQQAAAKEVREAEEALRQLQELKASRVQAMWRGSMVRAKSKREKEQLQSELRALSISQLSSRARAAGISDPIIQKLNSTHDAHDAHDALIQKIVVSRTGASSMVSAVMAATLDVAREKEHIAATTELKERKEAEEAQKAVQEADAKTQAAAENVWRMREMKAREMERARREKKQASGTAPSQLFAWCTCTGASNSPENFVPKLESVTVATLFPNTNHTGLYVALKLNLYSKFGLDVRLLVSNQKDLIGHRKADASDNTVTPCTTPCEMVAENRATFAVDSPEAMLCWNSTPSSVDRPKLTAVAAILQQNTMAIVTSTASGIDRPAKLDGKRYASHGTGFEGHVLKKVIQKDGGAGVFAEVTDIPMLGLLDTVLATEDAGAKCDATRVSLAWEG